MSELKEELEKRIEEVDEVLEQTNLKKDIKALQCVYILLLKEYLACVKDRDKNWIKKERVEKARDNLLREWIKRKDLEIYDPRLDRITLCEIKEEFERIFK